MSRNSILKGLGISVVSAAAGAGVAWFVTNKILGERYEERLDAEVAESVKFLVNQMHMENVVVTDADPDDLIAGEGINLDATQPVEIILDEVEKQLDEQEERLDQIEEENAANKIFGSQEEKPPLSDLVSANQAVAYHKISTPDPVEEPVAEVELPEMVPEDPEIPVISRDIFLENGTEWEQETLTYFEDGGVLNVRGDFVEDHELLIGIGRPRFGELSEDPNVVYVRNKKLEKEFEVLYDPGNATEFLTHSLIQTFRPSWQS